MNGKNRLSTGALGLFVALTLCGLLSAGRPAAAADRWHSATIYGADYVDLSYLGSHTHSNSIGFSLSRLSMPRASRISAVPHCWLYTNSRPYGTIEHWNTRIWGNTAYVTVPTQFADVVFGLWWSAPYTAQQYYDDWAYYVDVSWYGP